ncbi:putative nucleotidyltransferase component of viral defense system [Novosphingobium kunmingense]|uniref:Putative nucleotidyltransferase component of viral defense system n=1 Tax=Novosphingobium kunmingense TaxID=1211806 RepID=A0A2N0H7K2_9SPHN|nr:putative nucleotidyltransferase component of viral defense system [Novosphingobium kunmingense]
MAEPPKNLAASVKARLLNMAREQSRNFDILLVRFALERLLFRLAQSEHRDRYVLKGGMLVTHWLEHDNRETKDMDFLGFGPDDAEAIKQTFAGIMAMEAEDGLIFDVDGLAARPIREEMEYGGIRLRTYAYLERTRISITLDIGFGDALADAGQVMDYPSLLGMERPNIRSYPPETVIAEKFQAVVALGLANGRMKDFYDLWALPRTLALDEAALDAAIAATFARRQTAVPTHCPPGLSDDMSRDPAAAQRWRAYIASLDHPELSFADVLGDIWISLAPNCARLLGAK